MKRFLKNILRTTPRFERLSYETVRNERHVFAFGVWGRTSTTALQRILNSSRELCIWGEPGEYLIDNLMDAYVHIRERLEAPNQELRMRSLPSSFRSNRHSTATPMAMCDWSPSRAHLEQAVVDLLQPVIPIRRLGFKEIRVRSLRTLDGLRLMFPNCEFLYVFRDPLAQWPSVQTRKNWKEATSIELFIERVEAMAEFYQQRQGVFIEDQDLRKAMHLDHLAKHLGITGYNHALVGDGVFAADDKVQLSAEEERLLTERLGAVYARLQDRAAGFFAGGPAR